jgi:nickel superoxide dismutase
MKTAKMKLAVAMTVVVVAGVVGSIVYGHCQIPCGIYGDPMRFDMIAEHITTIEKSMNTINAASKMDKPDTNQLVRWIENKDHHADELSEIVTYYFMAQRVKPVEMSDAEGHAKYVKQLTLLHKMLVHSMKCKQTTDLEHVESLRTLLKEFHDAYSG